MKVRLFSLAIVAFALLLVCAPAWSAETPAQETTAAATDEKPIVKEAAANQAQPAETPAQSAIQIEDAVVSQDIVDRAPVGSGDVFAKETTKLYCFTRVVGSAVETQITHNWYYQGTLRSSVKLPVRSNNWRTWSSKTMTSQWTGEWMVEILSEEGTPLESIIFFIQ